MEWSPGFFLIAHEHHGRPCFEYIQSGHLEVTNFSDAKRIVKDKYRLVQIGKPVNAKPGQFVRVDPRVGDIHSVRAIDRSQSVHFYPDDNFFSYGYEKQNGSEIYVRKKFKLEESKI